jgi:hypothetical protein
MRFFMKDGKRMAEDLGSRWGTKLNGAPLTDPAPLKHGDEIRLGKSTINYLCYWDLLPQQQGEMGGMPVSVGPGTGFGEERGADFDDAPSVPPAMQTPAVVEAVKSAPRVPTPVPEIKPEPPPPDPEPPPKPEPAKVKPKEVKAPAKPPVAPARPPKRNYWGFDVGGAIFIVLLVVAGMLYLAYLVFKH